MKITLISARHYHADMTWGDENYVVLDDKGQLIGRIMPYPQPPKERHWLWTITTREYPPTIHSRGYSLTREEALADFKDRWLS